MNNLKEMSIPDRLRYLGLYNKFRMAILFRQKRKAVSILMRADLEEKKSIEYVSDVYQSSGTVPKQDIQSGTGAAPILINFSGVSAVIVMNAVVCFILVILGNYSRLIIGGIVLMVIVSGVSAYASLSKKDVNDAYLKASLPIVLLLLTGIIGYALNV